MTRSPSTTQPSILDDDRHDQAPPGRARRVVELDPRHDLVAVIATMLADTRRRAGLSQRQLAAAAGVGRSMIAAYEAGRRHPTVTTLTRILTADGVHVALALTPATADTPPSTTADASRPAR